jgi:hypothetical protein
LQIARLGDAALDADNAAEYDTAWGKKQRQIDLDANAQAARFAAARRDALDNGYDQVWGISADRQESIARNGPTWSFVAASAQAARAEREAQAARTLGRRDIPSLVPLMKENKAIPSWEGLKAGVAILGNVAGMGGGVALTATGVGGLVAPEPTGLTKAAGFVAFSGGLAITGKNAAAFNQNLGNLISAFQGKTDPDAYEPNSFAEKVAKDAGWSNDAVVLAGVADAAADLVSGNFINGYSFGVKTIRLPGNPHIPALLQKERMLSFDMKIGRQASIDAPKIWGYSEKIGGVTSAAGIWSSTKDVYSNKFGGD